MSNTIVFITGANTGLGFEIVKALYQSSTAYTILLGGRNLDKANAAAAEALKQFPSTSSVIKTIQIDIDDDTSINNAFEHVSKEYGRVDVLINNAGGQFDQQWHQGQLSLREMFNKSWNTNTTGTYILTHTFAPLLLASSTPRLLFITSGTSTLAEHTNPAVPVNKLPTTKGWPKQPMEIMVPAYRSSKTGMNMMMREWVRLLGGDGVKVWAVSPGFLATGLGFGPEQNKKMGALDPAIGGNFVKDVVEGKRDADVGKAIRKDGVQPW